MENLRSFNSDMQTILPLLDRREVEQYRSSSRFRFIKKIKSVSSQNSPLVSIITPTNKNVYLENIFRNYSNQIYKNKELIIILNSNRLNLKQWVHSAQSFENVKVFQLDESVSLGECLNHGVKHARGEYIARFDDDDFYGSNYLPDLLDCFLDTEASVVGKSSRFVYFTAQQLLTIGFSGTGYRYTPVIDGGTFIIKRGVFDKIQFAPISLSEDNEFTRDCENNGLKVYAGGPFNFIQIRRTHKDLHTWKIDDQDFLTHYCLPLVNTDQPCNFATDLNNSETLRSI